MKTLPQPLALLENWGAVLRSTPHPHNRLPVVTVELLPKLPIPLTPQTRRKERMEREVPDPPVPRTHVVFRVRFLESGLSVEAFLKSLPHPVRIDGSPSYP
ncbi:hypothetical protein [Candidatus Methylacidithermus pantelleriae]|uniref:hypothetical protein n=1 Tax=Candidatus Methylacidithermus pantelleriae TaxID=2744239 RepID=UPI00157C039D|nr:hypothetical protein [Candidatus Methylacidithermus pantelleriae]